MNAFSLRDVRGLLELAGAIEYDPRQSAFKSEGLMALLALLEADWVTYCEGPVTGRRSTVRNEVETRPFEGRAFEAVLDTHFDEFKLACGPTPHDGVVLIGDVMPTRIWRRSRVYNEWCREVHVEPQARISLTLPGSATRRTVMFDLADDAGRTFGERERALLKLARPVLLRPLVQIEAARQRRCQLGLTVRELAVLDLVRAGMTNGEIATQMFLSPATVRTHLEHAFAKLHAHTRTEALARLDATDA
jgi:DNA-binding CsgD family transcriptional regulator